MVGISGRSRGEKKEEDRRRHKLEEKHKRLDNPPTPFQNGELKFLFPEAIGLFGEVEAAASRESMESTWERRGGLLLLTKNRNGGKVDFLAGTKLDFSKRERWQGGFD